MTDTGAVVDVVVTDRNAHQLLHQVVFLIGTPCRRDGRDRLRTVAFLDRPELVGDEADRLVPICLYEPSLSPDKRSFQAVRRSYEAVCKTTLYAGVSTVYGRCVAWSDSSDLIVARMDIERTPNPAVATGSCCGALDRAQVEQPWLRQRAGRA